MYRGELVRSYDRFMHSTESALRDPRIVAALGVAALDLRHVYDSAFLPNSRHGELSVPQSKRGDSSVAVVPFSQDQAADIFNVVGPLFDNVPLAQSTSNTYSERYNFDMGEEVNASIQRMMGRPKEEIASQPPPKVNLETAKTLAYPYLAQDGKTIYATRPVIALPSFLTTDGHMAAAAGLHEGIHASDILRDGPVNSLSPTYRVATEVRAYSTESVLGENWIAQQVESIRRFQADPIRPYIPGPMLTDFMIRNGYA